MLKRSIGLLEATFYGVGIILGAGIYALIGAGAGVAGNALWLAFIIGAIVAVFTGLSYAELASMYPKEAAEYEYTKQAFQRRGFSFVIEWVMFFTAVVSATTVALGFAGYFTSLVGGSIPVIAAVLLILLSVLNYWGIKESARFNMFATLLEIGGLLLVIALGAYYVPKYTWDTVDFWAMNNGLMGVLSATVLIFFAFIGFENVANISEETKNARRVVPKAILLSLGISVVLYVLVSLAAVGILGAEQLGQSKAPLTEVVAKVLPNAGYVLTLIALFATSNTVLFILIVGSRLLYGMARNRSLPAICARVGERGTPFFSVAVVGGLALAGLLLGSDITNVALLTDVGIFLVYIGVNLALLVLRYRMPDSQRIYKAPFNIGKFSVTAFLGIVSCTVMLFFFEARLVLYEVLAIVVGVLLYFVFRKKE